MRYKGVLIDDISIFNTPKIYLELVTYILKDCFFWTKKVLISHGVPIIIAIVVSILIANINIFSTLYAFIIFTLYWVILGVASSIGLGTGLHTFILYLGPHIARVALNATLCGVVPPMLPSRWAFNHFGQCNNPNKESIGILGIVWAVQLESILWGLGTAIGELPPYFVAKKAAETRIELKKMEQQAERVIAEEVRLMDPAESQQLEVESKLQNQMSLHKEMPRDEIEDMMELRRRQNLTCIERIKLFIYNNMERYGFLTILLFASIPNPLFDLAGIMSGHFRIPFKTFFSATIIGKAVIKVHLQMVFIITIFRKQTLDMLIKVVQIISSSLAHYLSRTLEAKKKQFNQPQTYKESKSFLGVLWDLFITGMLLFFLKSIVDAYVKEKAIVLRDS